MSDMQKTEKDDNPVQKRYDDEFDKLTSPEHMSKDGESRDNSKRIDLDKAEKDAGKTDGQDSSAVNSAESQGLYSPSPRKGGSGKGSTSSKFKAAFSGRKKYGWMGGSTAIIITLVVFIFSILSGPSQLIHASHVFQSQLASLELMSNRRTGAFMASYEWGGKNPYIGSRLGTIGNRVSNTIETNLNKNGIELITTNATGVLKGVVLDGKVVAEFDGSDRNKFRRDVTKSIIAERMGWNKTTTALMTRLPFARYDVSLRVMGNIKRGVDESIEVFRERVRDERSDRISDTSFNYDSARQETERLEELEKSGEITDAEQAKLDALRAADGDPDSLSKALSDTYDNTDGTHTAKQQATAKKFESISANAGGASIIAMVLALSCLVDSLADISRSEAYETYTSLIRMAGEGMSVGSQVESGINVDPNELGVYNESLYEPADDTSWIDSSGFGGPVEIPAEYKFATRNVSSAARVLQNVEKALDLHGIGLLSENRVICSTVTNPWFTWGLFVVEVGAAILSLGTTAAAESSIQFGVRLLVKELVGDFVVGKGVNSTSNFVISLITGSVVPALARGALYGSITSMGSHYAANEAGRSAGATSLSPEQSAALNNHLRDLRLEESAERGFAYKYFDTSNPYSLVSSMLTSVSNKGIQDAVKNLASFISAPSKIIGGFFSSPVLALEAAAAAELEAGAPSVKFSMEEIYPDDDIRQDPFLAEAYVKENNLEEKYGACFKSPADMFHEDNLEALEGDFYLSPMPGLAGCDYPDTAQEEYDYSVFRVHHFDVLNLLSLGCLEGEDEASCRELGVDDGVGGVPTAPTVNGLLSPPNLAPTPDDLPGEYYYHMPDSLDSSYEWNGGTPERSRCGSKTLIDVAYTVAQRWKSIDPHNPIRVGDLNEDDGHASHRNGVDIDIFMKYNDVSPYTFATTSDAIKVSRLFADTDLIKIIYYNDPAVIRDFNDYVKENGLNGEMKALDSHNNHLHVRILDEYRGPESGGCGE